MGLSLGQPLSYASAGLALTNGGVVRLATFAAALARLSGNSGRAVMSMIGDSTTAGAGAKAATGDGAGSNAITTNLLRQNSAPHQIAALWTAAGVPSRGDAVWGNMNAYSTGAANQIVTNGNDTTITSIGSDWTFPGAVSIGGQIYRADPAQTTAFAYVPEFNANRFDIYYTIGSGFGTFVVQDAAQTTTYATVNCNGTATTLGKVTVTRANDDTAPIKIARNGTGGAIALVGIVPWSTVTYRLEVWNMGAISWKASDMLVTTASYSPFNALDAVSGVDLWTVGFGVNEQNQGQSAATFQTSLQSLATKLVGRGGDVALVKEHKASSTGSGYYMDAAHLAVPDTVAANLNLPPVINLFDNVLLGTGDYFDVIHLSQQGYGKNAAYIRQRVAAMAVAA